MWGSCGALGKDVSIPSLPSFSLPQGTLSSRVGLNIFFSFSLYYEPDAFLLDEEKASMLPMIAAGRLQYFLE